MLLLIVQGYPKAAAFTALLGALNGTLTDEVNPLAVTCRLCADFVAAESADFADVMQAGLSVGNLNVF